MWNVWQGQIVQRKKVWNYINKKGRWRLLNNGLKFFYSRDLRNVFWHFLSCLLIKAKSCMFPDHHHCGKNTHPFRSHSLTDFLRLTFRTKVSRCISSTYFTSFSSKRPLFRCLLSYWTIDPWQIHPLPILPKSLSQHNSLKDN